MPLLFSRTSRRLRLDAGSCGRVARRGGRRILWPSWPIRLRQDNHTANDRRAGKARLRLHQFRRSGDYECFARAARFRHGLSELRTLSSPELFENVAFGLARVTSPRRKSRSASRVRGIGPVPGYEKRRLTNYLAASSSAWQLPARSPLSRRTAI